jgi:methylmalonyl-CoA mutase
LQRFNSGFFRVSPDTPGGWENLVSIRVFEEKKANTLALQALTIGAEGIFFDIVGKPDVDIDILLEKISWPFCNISFLSEDDQGFVKKIVTHIKNQNYDPLLLRGSIFWKKFPAKPESLFQEFSSLKNFRTFGIAIPPGSPVKEISHALVSGVSVMEALIATRNKEVFKEISISVACSENFLLNIAKLKTLRILWYQISQAYEITNFKPDDLFIHARSEKWVHEYFQPHGNTLNNTYDAIAAVLGECNALTLAVEDEDNSGMHRTAQLVSNILREEAHLDKVAGGIAGSYVLDNMIHQLAQESWKDFQQTMAQ